MAMNQTSPDQSLDRRRRSPDRLPRFDPRPASPGQLAVVALGVWLVGALIPALHILGPVGLALLLVAGLGYLIRPRPRTMYWRDRKIDLGDEPGATQRMYRTLFKH